MGIHRRFSFKKINISQHFFLQLRALWLEGNNQRSSEFFIVPAFFGGCKKTKISTPTGFEPVRAEPNWFRINLLNHSDKASYLLLRINILDVYETPRRRFRERVPGRILLPLLSNRFWFEATHSKLFWLLSGLIKQGSTRHQAMNEICIRGCFGCWIAIIVISNNKNGPSIEFVGPELLVDNNNEGFTVTSCPSG